MYIAGIDEAGRGPVLGPMVMAIVSCSVDKMLELEPLGIKDSKLLTKEKREELYSKIIEIVDEYYVVKVSAKEIDERRKKESLNLIEAKMGSELINKLKNKQEKIYIDCPDINTGRYKEVVYGYLDKHTNLIVEHKADTNYLIAGAASIIAKVERDNSMKEIENKFNLKLGSGYPHDPDTIRFIKKISDEKEVPIFVRQSWQTFINAKTQSKQRKLF